MTGDWTEVTTGDGTEMTTRAWWLGTDHCGAHNQRHRDHQPLMLLMISREELSTVAHSCNDHEEPSSASATSLSLDWTPFLGSPANVLSWSSRSRARLEHLLSLSRLASTASMNSV